MNRVLLFLSSLMLSCWVAVTAAQAADSLSIVTYNVENLFDTRDDPDRNDHTYLPLSAKRNDAHRQRCAAIEVDRWRRECLELDWSEAVLEAKLEALQAVILSVDDGRGPDLLVLQEVENLAVLERLRRVYLQAAGYGPAILLEGADRRGIDVAFLSRLPQRGPAILHTIPFVGFPPRRVEDTRGILEASFELPDGALLTAFAVHFPAPFHPRAMRAQALAKLNALLDALPPDRPAVAAGDFNITSVEDREYRVLERLVEPRWQLGHRYGCDGCRGTYYYYPDDNWSFLDMIFWARPRAGVGPTWRLVGDSARLVNGAPGQNRDNGTPLRFDPRSGRGASDHWPLLVRVEPVPRN